MSLNTFLERILSGSDKRHRPRNPFSRFWYRNKSGELLSSGYRRSEYHRHGVTDEDIDFWGLDQPGTPPPSAAAWMMMESLYEMDADSDGLVNDPFDDPLSWQCVLCQANISKT
jgi:hypothetical protein